MCAPGRMRSARAPPRVQAEALRRLEGDVRARYGSVPQTVEVPNQISFVFVRIRGGTRNQCRTRRCSRRPPASAARPLPGAAELSR
jgi:hypothetical protein